jgi:hypothetical protein
MVSLLDSKKKLNWDLNPWSQQILVYKKI